MVNGYKPQSLEEALKIKNEDRQCVPYGGGTDLMIEAADDVNYLFLRSIPELKQISEDDAYIRIGSACTFTEVLASDLVPELMKEAVSRIAAPAIRNAGTMGGNIGNGSAKADSVLIEYVTDAEVVLASAGGERQVPIADFYKGRKQLDLRDDEIIREILIPKKDLSNYTYKKVGARNALAISRISFAGLLNMKSDVIENIAIAFGAVSDTVLRFREIEARLVGKTLDEAKGMREEFVAAYDKAINPTRGRVSSEYRKKVCLNLLGAFLDEKGL